MQARNTTTLLPSPRTWSALDRAPLDITRHPTPVEVSRLSLDLLSIDKTLPGPSVEAQEPFDTFEAFGRRVVAPDAVLDDVPGIVGVGHGVVRSLAFPLAVGTAGSGFQLNFKRARRQVVCWWMVGF